MGLISGRIKIIVIMKEDIFNEASKIDINSVKNEPQISEFEEQLNNESICPECDIEMIFTKKKRSNRWKKESSYYDCPVCGYHHRKRTINEILRDIGEVE
jgi:predicted RNA-binding Zn-ribbon protein involved in translation (DUF1610 family)